MKLVPLTPIDLFKVREVLEESTVFLKEKGLPSPEEFTNYLFLEEVPGKAIFFSIEEDQKLLGFIKTSDQFPLPGFSHIRLLVIKEKYCAKGYGFKAIDELKSLTKATLWIDISPDEASLKFWQKKGFKQEAGRWVL